MSQNLRSTEPTRLSRRAAVRFGAAAAGLAAGVIGVVRGPARVAAQGTTPLAAPAGWRAEHLEVEFTAVDAVTITRAGGGPPQRGDYFYVDAAVYAVGDVNGTRIGTYQCFGAWTRPSTDTAAPDQRLTTVQFKFEDGAIMGLINEDGAAPNGHVGPVQGGTGRYAAATGTFQQITVQDSTAGVVATPGAAGTPGTGQSVTRAVFDLLLPAGS